MLKRLAYPLSWLALASPLVAFLYMTRVGDSDPIVIAPAEHFYIVSAATLLSAAIATGLLLGFRSVRTTRNAYLALGFLGVAALFATHGLSTPGFITEAKGRPYAVIVSAGLSQIVGATFIFLSVLPARSLPGRFFDKFRPLIVSSALASFGAYFYIAMWSPQRLGILPEDGWWESLLATLTIAMLAYAAWRYFRAWRLTRFPAQFAMIAALILLAESQISMYYGTVWHTSWWMYHVLMFCAFSILIAGWVVEAVRARSLVLFSRAIALRDELDRVSLANPDSIYALEAAMEAKDSYTRHHMGRVGELAVGMARELGLDDDTVEVVQLAGRIHDIGKLGVPDAVLLKPGKLTEEEFAQVKDHSTRGERIARASSVLESVALVVRGHHERFAGGGYPDGLAGEQIPLAARIIAVADTFDALTSPRVYRGARPAKAAWEEIERVSGTQLDPACVAAFHTYLKREGYFAEQEEAA